MADAKPPQRSAEGRATLSRPRRPTIRDVAQVCGVVPSTVSNALRGERYVQPDTRDRILQAVADLGYRPSGIASSLRLRRSKTVALIGANLADLMSAQILLGVEEAALAQAYHVVVCNTALDHDRETQHIGLLLDKRIDGAIVMSSSLHDQNINWLQSEKLPLVLLNRRPANAEASFVGLDNQAGMNAVVEHLVALGHRRIAFVGGAPNESSVTRQKSIAFAAALAARQLEPVAIEETDFTFDGGYRASQGLLERFINRPVTAIVAVNDMTALGVMETANERSLTVPSDLSVVGWDDVFPASLRSVQLTTVHQPARKMGHMAAEILFRQISGEGCAHEEVIFQPTLVVRRTTGVWRERGDAQPATVVV